MNTIKLNSSVGMDLPKFRDGKLLLQANTGGGKSWAIRRIVEQTFGKLPIFILDTEGEFYTLREKFDFILIGKGQDIVPDPKTAALMAHRLIEERVSVIIDLLEMTPYERDLFVKNFVSAMTNAPRKLWLPTLLVVDEAQTYAPEGDKSECGRVLHDAAFKFRKRHYGMMFATPRISALSKNVISTCKNKLIGYTSLDNDMKRAAGELGFNSKEQERSLRDLDPGEFYAFGPAISKEVIKVQMGEVKTSHGDEGVVVSQVATPSAKVKRVLANLEDLPQAAAQEATTVAELKQQVKTLTLQLKGRPVEKVQQPMGVSQWMDYGKKYGYADFFISKAIKERDTTWKKLLRDVSPDLFVVTASTPVIEIPASIRKSFDNIPIKNGLVGTLPAENGSVNGPEQRILNAIATLESIGVEQPNATAVAFLAGYTYGGGGFNNPKGSLRSKGLIQYVGSCLVLTEEGRALAQIPDTPLTTEDLHQKVLSILPGPEQRLLKPLLEHPEHEMSNEELAAASGYTNGSGGFNNPKGRLRSLGLVEYPSSGRIKASNILFL